MKFDDGMMWMCIAMQFIATIASFLGQMQYVYASLLWAILCTALRIRWRLDQ